MRRKWELKKLQLGQMELAAEPGGQRKVDFSANIIIIYVWFIYFSEDCTVEGPLLTRKKKMRRITIY